MRQIPHQGHSFHFDSAQLLGFFMNGSKKNPTPYSNKCDMSDPIRLVFLFKKYVIYLKMLGTS